MENISEITEELFEQMNSDDIDLEQDLHCNLCHDTFMTLKEYLDFLNSRKMLRFSIVPICSKCFQRVIDEHDHNSNKGDTE